MPGPILNPILLLLLSISTTSNGAEYHPTAVINNKNNSTKTLFYLKTDITTSLSFAWQQAALCSLLFQFAVSHGPWVLVHCTAGNIRSLLTMHKGAGNVDMYKSYGWGSTGETWRQNVPRRDVRPSHDVTSDRHMTWCQTVTWCDVRPSHKGKDSLNDSSTR